MINRKSLVVMTPSHQGDVVTGYASGLFQCTDLIGALAFVNGMSEPNLARNLIAHAFLQLPEEIEWLVCIDADMEFSRQDFIYLCENIAVDNQPGTLGVLGVGKSLEAHNHAIVCAEYARRPIKHNSERRLGPAKFGLGFTRIHRDVFVSLQTVVNSEGDSLVPTFMREGQLLHDYFPTGAQPDGHWLSEDHGFFRLVQLAGIVPRIETRTRLVHWGKHGAVYETGEVRSPML